MDNLTFSSIPCPPMYIITMTAINHITNSLTCAQAAINTTAEIIVFVMVL